MLQSLSSEQLELLAKFAAIVALIVTSSILTSACMTLLNTIQGQIIKYDGDGNVVTKSSEAVKLRKRMLRFPRKASNFYYFSVSGLFFVLISFVARDGLAASEKEIAATVSEWLYFTAANAFVLSTLLVLVSAYSVFLAHSVLLYKRKYANLVVIEALS